MNDRVLRVLEYNKIIDKLRQHIDTSLGEQLVLSHKPSTNYSEVVRLQNETDEAMQFIRLNETIPLGGIFDIRESVKRSAIGGVLLPHECLEIGSTISSSKHIKRFIERSEEDLPLLKEFIGEIIIPYELEKKIKLSIDDHGEVSDQASEKLRRIRSAIRTYENRIRERLENFTRANQKFLSESIITIRNNRYVLPVKHEYRNTVGGIVHDQSASGQTLFMEPKAVVELNNHLREARLKEEQEIERILREISEQVANDKDILLNNSSILAQIDFIDARAKLSYEMNAVKPILNKHGIIKMKQARHPLIPENEVVANDIEIGESYTSILITGPNTGGKTVVLKMVGLCILMAQAGLQVPAMEGCELAVFDHVFADIGDEQSIEQSLSTFSSHMTNIVQIMKQVNHNSLVLFDEIGAGTDPQEGAALAMAILDDVISRNARVIATTHYPELKAYGYNRENVINASVEFDSKTLQPTYRLLIGIPGRSNAFDISKRLGLEEDIIRQAKSHLGIDRKSVDNMILSLEKLQKQTEKEYEHAHKILQSSEKLHRELAKEWKKFQLDRKNLFEKAELEAEEAVKKARFEAEQIVRELREMKESAEFKEHEWIQAKKVLDEAAHTLPTADDQVIEQQIPTKDLRPGDEVEVLSLKQKATILEKINDKEYLVQMGIMRVNIKSNDLKLARAEKVKTYEPVAMVRGSNASVPMELDLRGERYEEAVIKLEQYVDRALLAGHAKVTIIHGKGTGALRNGVHEFAKQHPHIAAYRPGSMNEGGSGVTVIEFS